MTFKEKLKTDPGFSDDLRRPVTIDKMTPEELLDLPVETIQNFEEKELSDVMEKIMHGYHYLTLDEHNRTSFDSRWRKYMDIAFAQSKFDNNQ